MSRTGAVNATPSDPTWAAAPDWNAPSYWTDGNKDNHWLVRSSGCANLAMDLLFCMFDLIDTSSSMWYHHMTSYHSLYNSTWRPGIMSEINTLYFNYIIKLLNLICNLILFKNVLMSVSDQMKRHSQHIYFHNAVGCITFFQFWGQLKRKFNYFLQQII